MVHCAVVTFTALVLTLISIIDGFGVNRTLPSARIIVHVSKRRATYWEPWEVNRRICPPSLCRSSDTGGEDYRPRGTAGTVFYQGDIILHRDDEKYIYGEKSNRRKRATMRLRHRLWKNGRVPYEIDSRISPMARRFILQAFDHIQQKTCIKFKKKRSKDKDYVRYISEPGCWSNVGKRGGMQLISLGRGCENLGTAVHETSHSLGVWHEQARTDRDRYVKILEGNISPKYLPDFQVISRRASTSRGYPYDYLSVMHYNKWAFTRAGDPTIEVIGIGKKLGLEIGQRLGLSTIDMAQLREMYHCNRKEDSRLSSCPSNWIKYRTTCYKFHDRPPRQFSAANKECEKEDGHLLALDSKTEDRFIQKYIRRKYKSVRKWRLGGKLVNGTMMWFKGDKTKPKAMKYTNWDVGMPSSFTTAVIARSVDGKSFKWHGVWAGSRNQLPAHSYPFICEKRARRKCLKGILKDGRNYRGKLDHTVDGITCQKWSDQYPHQHKLKPKNKRKEGEDSDGLGNHNYCRNPSGHRRKRPWCYTAKKNKNWQYCDITPCGGREIRRKVKQDPRLQQTRQKQKKYSKNTGRITQNEKRNRDKKSLKKRNDRKNNKSAISKKNTKESSKRQKSSSNRNIRNKFKTNTREISKRKTRSKLNQKNVLKPKVKASTKKKRSSHIKNYNSNSKTSKSSKQNKRSKRILKQKAKLNSNSKPSKHSLKTNLRTSKPKTNKMKTKI